MHTPCLMCSIIKCTMHGYPMTVLLKIIDNFMTVLLESLSVLLEGIDLFGLEIELLEKRSGYGLTSSYGSDKDKN